MRGIGMGVLVESCMGQDGVFPAVLFLPLRGMPTSPLMINPDFNETHLSPCTRGVLHLLSISFCKQALRTTGLST